MRRSVRVWSVGVVVCLVGVLAGCGVDLAKKSYPRTTVPAAADLGQASSSSPSTETVSGDEAFLSKNMRLLDPCGLLSAETLADFGTPAKSRLRDYGMCSNYMKDKAGKEFNVTLTIGESVTGTSAEGSFKIGGLPANESELDDKTACFIKVITDTSPKRAMVLQLGGPGGLCEPGRRLLETMVKKVRDGAPKLKLAKGTMVALDPCEVTDSSIMSGAEGRGSSLHDCDWTQDSARLAVDFRVGMNPDELADTAKTTPQDIGGVSAQKKHETNSGDRCRLEWAHTSFPPDTSVAEVVSVEYGLYQPKAGEDTCAKAIDVAKALLGKLPAK